MSWKRLVHEVISALPREFTLRDLEKHRAVFAAHYPENRFIDAKLRQSLQLLRDQGVVAFLGGGRYRRLDRTPVFSPLFDPTVATAYVSRAQAARVMLETWAELNLYCVNCTQDALQRLPANTPVADFSCDVCDERYQIKSKDGRFGDMLPGAAYEPTIAAVRAKTLPSFVLVEFDRRHATVVFVDAVPGNAVDESRVIARKPLTGTARRAGWVGCTLRISGLPSVRLVEPAGLPRDAVRAHWHTLKVADELRGTVTARTRDSGAAST